MDIYDDSCVWDIYDKYPSREKEFPLPVERLFGGSPPAAFAVPCFFHLFFGSTAKP